jgi:putative flippase GtrA
MSLSQAVRFGAVGLVNTFAGLLVIYSLKYFAAMSDVKANALGYAVGMIISFGLNRNWTFAHRGVHSHSAPRFLVTMAISYGVNLAVVLVALHAFGVNAYVAQVLGMPAFTVTSFLLCKYWVFPVSRNPGVVARG